MSVPTISALRLTGAADRAELPLLVLGPSLGTSAASLWTDCATVGLSEVFDVVAWDLPRSRVQPRRTRRVLQKRSWRSV